LLQVACENGGLDGGESGVRKHLKRRNMREIILISTTLDKHGGWLKDDLGICGPEVHKTDLNFTHQRVLVQLEEHLVLKVASLVLDILVVNFVFVSLLVDWPIDVLHGSH